MITIRALPVPFKWGEVINLPKPTTQQIHIEYGIKSGPGPSRFILSHKIHMDKEKPQLLFRNLCFIHQFYNLLTAYKISYTRFANILEVARAEQTERLFWADSPSAQSLLAPLCLPQKGSRIIYESSLGAAGVNRGFTFPFLRLHE